MQAARNQDRRLAVALLAAAVAHTPEAEEVLRGARMRMARKPSAVARELLRNLPKGSGKKRRRRSKRSREGEGADAKDAEENAVDVEAVEDENGAEPDDEPMAGTAEDPGEDDPIAEEDSDEEEGDDLEPASPPISASDHDSPDAGPERSGSNRRRRRRRAA